jgi:hypothetical protein
MIEDDVNVRVRVVASDKKGRNGYERYARDRFDIERRDVMAAYLLTGVQEMQCTIDVIDRVSIPQSKG